MKIQAEPYFDQLNSDNPVASLLKNKKYQIRLTFVDDNGKYKNSIILNGSEVKFLIYELKHCVSNPEMADNGFKLDYGVDL